MLISSLFYGAVIGSIVGIVWTLALGTRFSITILVGAIAGFLVALILAFFGKLARAGGNLVTGESYFVSNSILTFLGIAAGVIGLLVWTIRAIFF
jgi:hypothetical protein